MLLDRLFAGYAHILARVGAGLRYLPSFTPRIAALRHEAAKIPWPRQ